MTYDKIENLMKLLDTLRVYHEARIHDLHSDNLTVAKQDECDEKINALNKKSLICSKQNKSTALTRESRPYIIKIRASFSEQGRKRWKDGLKRISCIYVTVANMSCQDVIMSLLQNYHTDCYSITYPLQWKMTPLQWKLRLDPSDGK